MVTFPGHKQLCTDAIGDIKARCLLAAKQWGNKQLGPAVGMEEGQGGVG